ncbi:MAG: hypothetical protein J6127_08645 [Clostridiales bacterium]|nr:hypothetical protein [Clostridiales bacterium]
MAQSRSTSGRKRSSSSSSRKRAPAKAPARAPSSGLADYFHAFSKTRFFAPIMSAVVIAVLILLDMLVAWNNYDRFFKILGFELLIAGIVWVIGLVLSFGESSSSGN